MADYRTLDPYASFAASVAETKRALLELLIDAEARRQQVVGYGAPGKGNTLLNYCGIRTDLIDYTVDRNPHKQGKHLPGTHIPIYAPERIDRDPTRLHSVPALEPAEGNGRAARVRPEAWGARLSCRSRVRRCFVGRLKGQAHPPKVVLFCGGLGLRMGESSARVPKPMIPIGDRPIIWHIMKYYASFGLNYFVLCLGHRAEVIKEFFLDYNEAICNDFVLSRRRQATSSSWRATSRTGRSPSSIPGCKQHRPASEGRRELHRRRRLLPRDLRRRPDGRPVARDGRAPSSERQGRGFPRRPPDGHFPRRLVRRDGGVGAIRRCHAGRPYGSTPATSCLQARVFDYIARGRGSHRGAVPAPDRGGKLIAYPYEGFWAPMDTLKDKHNLDALLESGRRRGRSGSRKGTHGCQRPT